MILIYCQPLHDNWKYTPDVEIARNIFSSSHLSANVGNCIKTPQLCYRCQDLQLWTPRYTFSDTFTELAQRSSSCDLCGLLWRCTRAYVTAYSGKTQFFRVGSSLALNHRQNQPIVSIYVMPSHDTLGMYPSGKSENWLITIISSHPRL
jgi:hypothetical protein